jgi:hypothetical protein
LVVDPAKQVELTIVETRVRTGYKVYGLLRNDTTQTVVVDSVVVQYLDAAGVVTNGQLVPSESVPQVALPGEIIPWVMPDLGVPSGGSVRVKALGTPTLGRGAARIAATALPVTTSGSYQAYRFEMTNTTGGEAAMHMWRGYALDSSGKLMYTLVTGTPDGALRKYAAGSTRALVWNIASGLPQPASFVMVGEYLRAPVVTAAFSNDRPFAGTQTTLEGTVRDGNGNVMPGVTLSYQNQDGRLKGTVTTGEDGAYSIPVSSPLTGYFKIITGFDAVGGVLEAPEKRVSITWVPKLFVRGVPEGWSNRDVTVAFADPWCGADAPPTVTPSWSVSWFATPTLTPTSTVGPFSYRAPIVVSAEGTRTIEYWANDSYNTQSPRESVMVRIDRTAPESALSARIKATYKKKVTLSVVATDALSGVAATYYRVDKGVWKQGSVVKITKLGKHTVSFYSVDVAGNTELARKVSFKVVK